MSEREKNSYIRSLRRDEIVHGVAATIGAAAFLAAEVRAGINITHHDIPRGIQMIVEGSAAVTLAAHFEGKRQGIRQVRKAIEARRNRFQR